MIEQIHYLGNQLRGWIVLMKNISKVNYFFASFINGYFQGSTQSTDAYFSSIVYSSMTRPALIGMVPNVKVR
jgi:hypothetical protein